MIQVQDCHEAKTLSDKFTKAELIDEIFRLRKCQENQATQSHHDQKIIVQSKEEIQVLQVRCNDYFEKATEAKRDSDKYANLLDETCKRLQEVDDDKRFLKALLATSNVQERNKKF